MRAHLASDENQKKAYRVKQAWDARKAQVKTGRPPNQNLPSWLKWHRDDDKITVIEPKAEVVRKIFKLYVQGNSMAGIAQKLAAEGAPAVSKKKVRGYTGSYVHRILTSKAVIGICSHVDPPQPGIYPPIVSETVFYLVQAKIKQRQRLTVPIRSADVNLFTGVCRCGICNSAVTMHSQKRNGFVWRYLVCSRAKEGLSKCTMAGFRYEKFERAFGFAMSHTVRVREALAEDIGAPSQLDALRGQLATAEKLAEKYLREFEKDDSPSPRAMARLKEVETEENRLRELVLNEEASQKARTPAGQSYEKLQKLDLTNREHRVKFRELVRDVVDHVVIEIGQNRFTIFFKSGKSVEVSVGPAGTWITWRWRGDV